MTTAKTELLTADDLLRLCSTGVRGELIRGVLRETMPTGEEHGWIVTNLVGELVPFTKPRRLGRLIASDAGILLERDPDTVREPDIAFTSAERLPPGGPNPKYAEVVPDLVVEVVSPGDSAAEVADRAAMWLGHGVQLVWIVQPSSRTIEAHRAGATARTLGEGDRLDGEDVLPGFDCPVAAVFAE